MARLNTYTKLLKSALFALLLSSCTTIIDWDKQIETLITGQSYVIPIGETTLTLNDIITQIDNIHYVEPGDNYIFLNFKDTITWNFRDVVDFQNFISINRDYTIPATPSFTNDTIKAPPFTETINLNFNSLVPNQSIERTEINKAKLEITIEKSNNMNIDPSSIRVITYFKDNGLVFANGGNIENGKGSSIEYKPTVFNNPEIINLNPFTIFSPESNSALSIEIRVEVIAGNTPIVIPDNSFIKVKYKLFDIDTKAFFGIIQPTIRNDEKGKIVDMTQYIMQLPIKGVFKIAEPIIKFDVLNNSGVKINLMLDSIKAYKSDDATFEPVYAHFDGSKSISKIVERIPSYGGEPFKSTFYLDHTLSNGDISHFFDRYPLPDRLLYKFRLANARTASDPLDFATPNANLTAHIDIKVPLKFNAGSNFDIVDTLMNMDLNDLIDNQIVDQMTLVLKVTNNLPIKGKLSIKFLDTNNLPINDLKVLADSVITAPPIDDNGYVAPGETAVSNLKIIVANEQLPKLRLAKSLMYIIKVENDENRKMTLHKDNFIKLKLGKYSQGE